MSLHPFYDMFDSCKSDPWLVSLLETAKVESVSIDKETRTMTLTIRFETAPAPIAISAIQRELKAEFGLHAVTVYADYPKPEHTPQKSSGASKKNGTAIMGRVPSEKPMPMSEVSLESGKVHVAGDVFFTDHRHLEKRNSHILRFSITDYSGSVQVSKFFQDAAEGEALCQKIEKGMTLHVRGTISYNRYDGDITLEPTDISIGEKVERMDEAPEKRVELHLHTRYSALDALSDPGALVKQAAKWGHPAIAITDHGVAHAFPEAHAATRGSDIKVIYGLEGYYINDRDRGMAVQGFSNQTLEDEFIAFDLETTGLSAQTEKITEIGAILMRGNEIIDTFQTFAHPGKPIPAKIVEITGITDADVKDAPSQKEALEAFLAFAGDRPLIAHNAGFDMGFVRTGLQEASIEKDFTVIDTLSLARALLPELRRHKLDQVARHLNLPDFNHHRAVDDAKTVALIMMQFITQLQDMGVTTLQEIGEKLDALGQGNNFSAQRARHIVLLAKNQVGLRNLYKLISLSHIEHFHRFPIIPKSLLMEHREGLLIGSACEAGELYQAILAGKAKDDIRQIANFYDYLEIQPLCNNQFLLDSGKLKNIDELKELNREIYRLGKALDKPVVATGDVHFSEPREEDYRKILLASKKFADADKPLPLYFKTTDEMLTEFSYLGPDAAFEVVVRNPQEIAARCEYVSPLPKGLFSPTLENSAEDLKNLVHGKMHELYGDTPPDVVRERVEIELGDIIGKNYDVIYMSSQILVQESLRSGYLVGSRGSVGSSIVAYLSGITEVNALPAHYRCPSCKHSDFDAGKAFGCGADMPPAICPKCNTNYEKDGFDIPFATFLGFGGDKIPDIDLNFSGDYQARAHDHARALFGEDKVFRSGTIGTIASKTAYGFVKKYLEERSRTVTKAEENRLTEGLVGVKRTTGQHPGGLVVIPSDKEIYDFCPVQKPADDKESDIITTHFEYQAIEDNLLKLDLLGHDDPTMIKFMADLTGVNAQEIPLDDPDTMSIFRSPLSLGLPENDKIIGETGSIAVPEFGTKFTREMLRDTKPTAFDTLVRLSGFSHGTDVWLGNAKDLILSGTATVREAIGCRDDIMLFLIEKGMDENTAFQIMESVRKGRGLKPDWVKEMQALKVPAWYIESCQKIKYLFPKAHAVAYVTMAFRIAWFKVHHPLAFYSAYFSARAKAFDAFHMCRGLEVIKAKIRDISNNPEPSNVEKDMLTTLEVCYEMYLRGIEFAPLDLYRSDATVFHIEGNTLLPPFTAVQGLGDAAAFDIIKFRGDRPFVSIEDFSIRCPKVSSAHITELQKLGVFGDLPESSQVSLF